MTLPAVSDEPSSKKRILVIEDEPDIVRGLRDALEFEGFEVQARGTGAEGLAAAMDWAPDAVLLDLMLPDDNGYRVCETLRQRDQTVPIIILTAKAQETDKIRGLDAGADDYVTKPFSVAELIARINAIFRRVNEKEMWGEYFGWAIPRNPELAPGASTNLLVMRSTLGYTGTQPRMQMLQNREFVDAKVEIYLKQGSKVLTKLAEYPIQRTLITHTSDTPLSQ